MPPDVLREARSFREQFGLRADEPWIVAVQSNPAATDQGFGIRLLPSELAELSGRALNAEAVVPVVDVYGGHHRDVFGGSYIDHEAAGRVVALFTAELSTHEAALKRLLHPDARWAVREVSFTEEELDELHRRILQDGPWFESSGILLGTIATDIRRNQVELVFYGPDLTDSDRIEARYQAGAMLRVIREPNSVAFLPRGSLKGRVVSTSGQPVGDLLIDARGSVEAAEPDGGVAYLSLPDGSFDIPRLASMEWTVQAKTLDPDAGWTVLGEAKVTIVGGQTANLVITIP